jgi:hypothetical protein
MGPKLWKPGKTSRRRRKRKQIAGREEGSRSTKIELD